MVHAAAKKKLMGSLLNVIRAIIDIMPGRRKTISITLQLTLASTQIQHLIHNFNFVLLYSELHYTKCIIKSCCDSISQIKNTANICSSNPLEINKSNSVFYPLFPHAIQSAGWEYFLPAIEKAADRAAAQRKEKSPNCLL